METNLTTLTPAEESAFLTLWLRALDHRRDRPILDDARSAELAREVPFDYGKLSVLGSQVLDLALRSKRLDDLVRAFVARHPDAVVVELGCGLDPRAERCAVATDGRAGVDWYDVDLPAVIALRDRYLPGTHTVAADLTTTGWYDAIPAGRPTMLVADGLMAFVTGAAFTTMVRRLTTHVGTGEFATNAYTRWDLRMAGHSGTFKALGTTPVGAGIDDPHEAEGWGAGLTLVREYLLARAPEIAAYPEPLRAFTRLCAHSARISRHGNRVLHYRF